MSHMLASGSRLALGGRVIALACSLACGGGGQAPPVSPPPGDETRSALARETHPEVSASDATQLANDNAGFAVELYRAARKDASAGNLVFSPESISLALAMTYAGAAGATATQMATTLHFSLPPPRLHAAFDALDLALASRGQGQAEGAFQLRQANRAWAQVGYGFLPTFLDTLAVNYGAGVHRLDFTTPEPARLTINAWVADQTAGKIPELLAMDGINGNTTLVLTNAVYFKAAWKSPFRADSPAATFHATTGDVSVPMMSGPDQLPLWNGAGYSAAALPYVGDAVSMVVLVPDAGTFASFESALTGESLQAMVTSDAATPTLGVVKLPRFAFRQRLPLAETLQSLGMTDAFTGGTADFSAMDGSRELFIQDVVHEATIAVDEKGTEATGATAVVVGRKALLESLTVDRPFLFVIRDNPTGAILFLGRVVDPSRS